jgi:FkbM family methyltransferase
MSSSLRRLVTYRIKRILMCLTKPLAPFVSNSLLRRIPVVGVVSVPLPGKNTRILFQTEGYDYTTSLLYWGGLQGYERGTVCVFLDLLRYVEIFIDIGANTGLYSLLSAVKGPGVFVYSFEPVPRIYEALARNIHLNKLENCCANYYAIGDRDGNIDLFVPRGEIPTGATASTARSAELNVGERITVPMVKLDTFVAREGINRVDLIKIDTETTEPRVIAGAKQTIARFRPMIICEVLRGKTEKGLQELMGPTGGL